ncbi:MAG TPA: 2-C-methyl-D-erythritol 2,4-cyclodiphosphate synthase [Bacteroidales bacterium]|jgi:2-C-methyl-D-erythritol 2,4-cyclodiphosphate synthase|nr:2-C-methyl-D-erythritol 2,4-cyclodiphosphate synthase [Bacteroidales bacterium]MDD4234611.1 2-C-methyl-D-erythritol 2,4-cyclodiphosphate synthase [Bacteroidales bacterium]HXK80673.1 2-C-methyl-D-erythritol 2,4-cyclodiphosphate synthase [Bacteroidales bacterium]
MKFRTGIGYDVHQLADNIPLVLGGVKIPYHKGCVAHSDGDVLIHAICDALFGAAAMRDIGYHFPDNDSKYKGISSIILLKECVFMIKNAGYEIANIDATVCLQKPKLSPFIPKMINCLSKQMNIEIEQVNIKVTTTEKLGFVGREEGISAQAIALIFKHE